VGELGMNNRGLLFTIMTLFLIFGIIALNESLNDISRSYSPSASAISAYSATDSFRNAERLLYDLDQLGYAKEAAERTLPFAYTFNKDLNYLSITQDISLGSAQINDLYSYLNITSVFLSDTNYSNSFTGTTFTVSPPKNTAWGGSQKVVHFLVNPLCYEYVIFDEFNSGFNKSSSSKCESAFNSASIKRFDVNITILSSLSDFNSFLCNGAACPTAVYNAGDSRPYYNITLIDTNCPKCKLSQKTASTHFVSSSDLNFTLKCTGASCSSPQLIVRLTNLDLNYNYSSDQKLSVLTKVTFNSKPNKFFISDVNLLATTGATNAQRKNN
jgi:hypothetical protein